MKLYCSPAYCSQAVQIALAQVRAALDTKAC